MSQLTSWFRLNVCTPMYKIRSTCTKSVYFMTYSTQRRYKLLNDNKRLLIQCATFNRSIAHFAIYWQLTLCYKYAFIKCYLIAIPVHWDPRMTIISFCFSSKCVTLRCINISNISCLQITWAHKRYKKLYHTSTLFIQYS